MGIKIMAKVYGCVLPNTPLANTLVGRLGLKPRPDPLFFSFFGLDLAMRERFTRTCNINQLIILTSKGGNLPRHAAAGGEVEGDWAKKKG